MSEALIKLPTPSLKGKISVEEAIFKRKSIRMFKTEPLSLLQLSQILWASQGITYATGHRAVPSAGATFPLEIFILVGENTVESLKSAIYHYEVNSHSLSLHREGDFRQTLCEAALDQHFIATSPVSMVVCALFSRTTSRYGRRGERYIHMEAGHLGQNISLQAIAIDLATVMVGAFHDEEVSMVLKTEPQIKPLYIIPIGKPM